ncbi:hypothetical protein T01_6252 [Trichinella spiralis]|uniref:Uncharacterized protein n=1 Tax=Trichinella spiralis TaxID=6334 RepID=A0A0V1AZU6_TRISP|nr:hypothetical protein T01_6252 [Trichinella spiralis]
MQMIEHGPFYSPIGTEFLNNTRYICIDGFSILQTLPALIDQETPPATSDTCQSKPIASATLKRQNGKVGCHKIFFLLSEEVDRLGIKFAKMEADQHARQSWSNGRMNPLTIAFSFSAQLEREDVLSPIQRFEATLCENHSSRLWRRLNKISADPTHWPHLFCLFTGSNSRSGSSSSSSSTNKDLARVLLIDNLAKSSRQLPKPEALANNQAN